MREALANEPLPPFLQQFVDRGVAEGETKGRNEGRTEGRAEGLAHALLRVLDRARIPLTDADRQKILSCQDPDLLDRWLDNAWDAKAASDVFQ